MSERISYSEIDFRLLSKTLPYIGGRPSEEDSDIDIPDKEGMVTAACKLAFDEGKKRSYEFVREPEISWGNYKFIFSVKNLSPYCRVAASLCDVSDNSSAVHVWMFRNRDKSAWENLHRLVDEEYRGNGLGKFAFMVQEAYLKGLSEMEGKAQKFLIDVEQLDVLALCLDQGFEPCTDFDKEKLDRVVANDGVVCATTKDGCIQHDGDLEEEKIEMYTVSVSGLLRDYVFFDSKQHCPMKIRLEKIIGEDRYPKVDGMGRKFQREALEVVR